MFTLLKRHLFAEKINGRKYVVGGLLPHTPDERDYGFSLFAGLFGVYEPKNTVLDIPTLSIKDQGAFNDCTWNAYTVQREVDEQKVLSCRSLVCYGRSKGYLSGNGFADLRSNQKAGVEFGLAEQSYLVENTQVWNDYANSALLSAEIVANAANHKDKSYFLVQTKSDWLKALDEGHLIHTGADWYSAYNMSGGLTAPWILPWKQGTLVGGHSFVCKGYDIQRGLLKFQNSYGADWGDQGCFYVRMTDWFQPSNTGYVSLKMDGDALSRFISAYEGKQVKGSGPVIYVVQNGQKRPFPNELVFYAFGGRFGDETTQKTWTLVSDDLLSKLPDGDPMLVTESPAWNTLKDNWPTLQWLKSPDNFAKIDQIMKNL